VQNTKLDGSVNEHQRQGLDEDKSHRRKQSVLKRSRINDSVLRSLRACEQQYLKNKNTLGGGDVSMG